MKKTYKEKYIEQKKENEYLKLILNNMDSELYNLKCEYLDYKKDLKLQKVKDDKYLFIFSIVGLCCIAVFAIISGFLGLF